MLQTRPDCGEHVVSKQFISESKPQSSVSGVDPKNFQNFATTHIICKFLVTHQKDHMFQTYMLMLFYSVPIHCLPGIFTHTPKQYYGGNLIVYLKLPQPLEPLQIFFANSHKYCNLPHIF